MARDAPRPVRGNSRGRTAGPARRQPGARRTGTHLPVFLRARLAERRGDVSQAAALVAKCLKEMPGRQAYLDFAVEVGAELPSRAREIAAERARAAEYLRTT